MTDVPTDLETLCAELATLYRQLADVITPAAALDRSLARDATERWCVAHEHYVPFGPVDVHRHVLGPRPTLAASVMATARPDNGTRRGVPGSRPPLSGPALDALTAQEGIWTAAVDLAGLMRETLGHRRREGRALDALAALPELVEAAEPGGGGELHLRAGRKLRLARQRARDVLGLSRDVRWLGECPGWFELEPYPILTRAGLVTDEANKDGTGLRCWTLDLAAMTERDGGVEVWRRSRLAMLRDETRPRVLCFACGYEPDEDELRRLALSLMAA